MTAGKRRGAGSMRALRVPSLPAAAASRRFAFSMRDSVRRDVAADRRRAVAEYLDGWPSVRIVAEHTVQMARSVEARLTLETARPLTLDAVREFLADCPHVVPQSVEAVAGDPTGG